MKRVLGCLTVPEVLDSRLRVFSSSFVPYGNLRSLSVLGVMGVVISHLVSRSPSGRPLDFHEIYSYSIHCLRGCSQQESSRRPTKAYPTSPKDNSLILHSPALTTEAEAEPSQETRGDILAHKAWQSSAWRTQRPLILPLRRGLSEYQRLLGPSFTNSEPLNHFTEADTTPCESKF